MKNKILLSIFILLLGISLFGCSKEEYIKDVKVTVINKQYIPEQIDMVPMYMPDGSFIYTSNVNPAEYNITVKYDDIDLIQTFNDKILYDNYNENDEINVMLYKQGDNYKLKKY